MKASAVLRFLFLAVALIGVTLLSGCASTGEPENQSSRPWNQPRGWESGVPGLLQNQQRY
ncbi:MAG: hypothetical protein ISQ14_05435 [Verrucomicrobiae bacterium]|nr:hypothetical protein [Verrucomicrobiae bacterium]